MQMLRFGISANPWIADLKFPKPYCVAQRKTAESGLSIFGIILHFDGSIMFNAVSLGATSQICGKKLRASFLPEADDNSRGATSYFFHVR